jgi:PHD/YefM family antitoxin component YafN of YafNO toxin-antitoxin module
LKLWYRNTYVITYLNPTFMIPKPITPTELRQNLFSVVREIATEGEQYLVTLSDGESVVMCSRSDYNALIEERQLLRDLRKAEADFAAGRTYTTSQVVAGLKAERARMAKRSK